MDRNQQLATVAAVRRRWVDKHLGEPGFDPDDGFMTPEQENDLYVMLDAAIPST